VLSDFKIQIPLIEFQLINLQNNYKISMQDIGGKARKKENIRKTKRKWMNNIKMDLREIGWGESG
jgi:hypothetical protein